MAVAVDPAGADFAARSAERQRERERVELVALALCQFDGREPAGAAWGAAVMEAFRYVAAFDALQRYDRVTAAFVAAPAQEQ